MEGTRIVLVRHGQSMAQHGGFLAGHAGCTGLSDVGREQAKHLAERLAAESFRADALYASEMARAQETAAIIAPALGGLEATHDCDLCEIHPCDDTDGLTWTEIEQRYPAPSGFDPDFKRTPGSESFSEMAIRVDRALAKLADRHPGETVVVACHGGVVTHSMLLRLGIAAGGARTGRAWLHAINTSLTEWGYGRPPWVGDDVPASWQLVRFNDHAHLPADLAIDV